jgi:hypothetical protein
MRTKALYVVLAIAVASGAAAYAALPGNGDGRAALRAHAAASAASALRISGHVRGLYPGARMGIRLKVRNGSSRWVVVRAIRADVRSGASGCSPDNLSTVPKELTYPRIRPHKTRRVGIRIRMWKKTPDACQGVTFPLRYKVRAGR